MLPEKPDHLEALLLPETALEQQLIQMPEFRHGLLWGEPRFGHPEGKVALHVREVLDNVNLIKGIDPGVRMQLRLIALVHDTFKYAEDRNRPRDWSKHHGVLARRFIEPHVDEQVILDIVELHDDAYYAWLATRHASELHMKSLDALMDRIGYCRQLYYLFFKCDTQTGDKTQAPLKWFEKYAEGIEITKVAEP